VLLARSWQEVTSVWPRDGNKPWPWADFYPVAKLTFARFNLSQIVLNTDSGQALAFGPGLTLANEKVKNGLTVISGHNDSHFSLLEKLEIGDEIHLSTRKLSSQIFRVEIIEVIDIRQTKLYINTNRENNQGLILVTCYPLSSLTSTGPYRLVVQASPSD